MSTLERLTADLTVAMKARDTFRVSTIRQVIGGIRTAEKSGKVAREFTDEQVQAALVAEVKKRRESAGIYTAAGAPDRAAVETAEADLIETYLPTALSEEETAELVAQMVVVTGATSMKDMGAVIRAVTAAVTHAGGRVDGKAVAVQVRAALAG